MILDDNGNNLDSFRISLESFRSFRGPLIEILWSNLTLEQNSSWIWLPVGTPMLVLSRPEYSELALECRQKVKSRNYFAQVSNWTTKFLSGSPTPQTSNWSGTIFWHFLQQTGLGPARQFWMTGPVGQETHMSSPVEPYNFGNESVSYWDLTQWDAALPAPKVPFEFSRLQSLPFPSSFL